MTLIAEPLADGIHARQRPSDPVRWLVVIGERTIGCMTRAEARIAWSLRDLYRRLDD